MNEWTELRIENIPPDILVGNYEFQFSFDDDDDEWLDSTATVLKILRIICSGWYKYRYRLKIDKRVGMFGKFWDNNRDIVFYGYLSEINYGNRCPYICKNVDAFGHFEPGLPSERIDV